MENFKPLTQEETLTLLNASKNGDEESKNKLIQGNFPLIKSVVKKFINRGVDYDDLYQIGCLGFLKAINNFNECYNVKFTTYAVPMIAGEIKRFLRDDGEIKVSRAIKQLSMKIRGFVDSYKKKNNDEPSIETIAKEFQVDCEDVVLAFESTRPLVSLYEKLDDNSDNSANLIDKIIVVDDNESIIDNILLKEAIESLDDREKKIILLRYFRGKTQSEIAEIMNVSQVQISRIEAKILTQLKSKIK